jgi:hypothetical protein
MSTGEEATTRIIMIEGMMDASVYDVPSGLVSDSDRVLMKEATYIIHQEDEADHPRARELSRLVDKLCDHCHSGGSWNKYEVNVNVKFQVLCDDQPTERRFKLTERQKIPKPTRAPKETFVIAYEC